MVAYDKNLLKWKINNLLHLEKDIVVISMGSVYHLEVKGKDFYLYIKTLTYAGSPYPQNTTRAQLPKREEFDKIKKDDSVFIFLGYDVKNDVFACWDPVKIKSRLNERQYVSLFSRLNLQEAVAKGNITTTSLNNDFKYALFKLEDISYFLLHIQNYFPDIKIGNEVLKISDNVGGILSKVEDDKSVKLLIDESLKLNPNLSMLTLISDCMNEFSDFYNRMKLKDWHKVVTKYVEKKSYNTDIQNIIEEDVAVAESPVKTEDVTYKNISSINHNLNNILFDRFKDILSNIPEYEKYLRAIMKSEGTVRNYVYSLRYVADNGLLKKYEHFFKDCIDYSQYVLPLKKLIAVEEIREQDVKWHGSIRASLNRYLDYMKNNNVEASVNTTNGNIIKESLEDISPLSIKVITSDGRVIQNENSNNTFIEIIENNYPDLIEDIDLGEVIISKDLSKFGNIPDKNLCKISNGYWINTSIDIENKINVLNKISEELELGLQVELRFNRKNCTNPNDILNDKKLVKRRANVKDYILYKNKLCKVIDIVNNNSGKRRFVVKYVDNNLFDNIIDNINAYYVFDTEADEKSLVDNIKEDVISQPISEKLVSRTEVEDVEIENVVVEIPSAEPYSEVEVETPSPNIISEKPIDIKILDKIFDNKSSSYKYLWFLSIITLAKEKDSLAVSYKNLMIRMAAIAWPLIYGDGLDFGKSDYMKNYLLQIRRVSNLVTNSSTKAVESYLIQHYDNRNIYSILSPLMKNVPYRFLSPWITFTTNEEVIAKSNSVKYSTLYALQDKGILLDEDWWEYIQKNYEKVYSFAIKSFVDYVSQYNNTLKLINLKYMKI